VVGCLDRRFQRRHPTCSSQGIAIASPAATVRLILAAPRGVIVHTR
jgi:hypothetical protein